MKLAQQFFRFFQTVNCFLNTASSFHLLVSDNVAEGVIIQI